MKNLFLIVGKSGSGKDYLCSKLEDKNHHQVRSYTTRPPRKKDPKDKTSHTFITEEEFTNFKNEDMFVYTKYNGNHYFVTKEMVQRQDLYIIGPAGITYILDKNKTKEQAASSVGIDKIHVIYIKRNAFVRFFNMVFRRKDSIKSAFNRIIYDYKLYKDFENKMSVEKIYDFTTKSVDEACKYIENMN